MTTTDRQNLDQSIAAAMQALLDCQRRDGEWCFELEADATIPSEYILFRHFLGEPIDSGLEGKIAVYLRRIQGDHGGWPLFHDGAFDMSASVKAYFALKMIGEEPDVPHMRRAREAILSRGGAIHCFLEARSRDQLHRPRDLADIADRAASFIENAWVGHCREDRGRRSEVRFFLASDL